MANFLLVFICISVGFFLQKVKQIPKNTHQSLNYYVLYVALPALALYSIPKIIFSWKLIVPISVAWIGFGLSFLFFYALGSYLKWSKKLIGCLILTKGLSNTSFVGFPIIEALYGAEGMNIAILIDQAGSFVVVTTLAVFVATKFTNKSINTEETLKKILQFPPFIAFLIALILAVMKIDFPSQIQIAFQKIGSTVSVVALVAVGFQLKFEKRSKHWSFLVLGLSFKLLLLPGFFYFLCKIILNNHGIIIDVSILEMAMPPMITGAILASNFGLKPKLSNMMVGFGIPLSFITVIIWYFILTHF